MAATTKSLERKIERARKQVELAQLESTLRAYEAANPTDYHHRRNVDNRSGNGVMEAAGTKLRALSRYLDENHDIATGILNDLVDNVVGSGINTLPMVKSASGELLDDVNEQISALYEDWAAAPEVTAELPWGDAQRLVFRSLLRDGEVFIQHITGGRLDHRTRVPYSQELIEADLCPFDYDEAGAQYGVIKDQWGRPIAYAFYLEHPGDASSFTQLAQVKRVSADLITHLKLAKRIRQTRGAPLMANIITRLEDLKDLEESKRIQERVAAAFSAVIKKGDPSMYDSTRVLADGSRSFEMSAGMIADNLLPGESVETLGANRPGTGLGDWRRDQIRAGCAGTGAKYSTVARDYSGSYSAQRQELVESGMVYQPMRNYFAQRYLARTHRELVNAAIMSGQLRLPREVDRDTLYDAEYQGPSMPWVDPEKELGAIEKALKLDLTTRRDEIIKRGQNPRRVAEQRAKEKAEEMEYAAQQDELFGQDEQPSDQQDEGQQNAA